MKTEPIKHTPGPWHVLPDPVWKNRHSLHEARFVATAPESEVDAEGEGEEGRWCFADPRDSIICTMPDAENQKANARLIAAAPELLAACEAFRDCDVNAWKMAVAAIAKAEGK